MREFILYAKQNKGDAIVINYFGNSLIEKRLKMFNYILREKDCLDLLIYSNDNTLKSLLSDKENWYFFMGDNDV